MNRRTLIASLLAFSGSAYAQIGSFSATGVQPTSSSHDAEMRRLLSQINRALPAIWSDHHVALARACDNGCLDFSACVRSAFGSDTVELLSLSPRILRQAYRSRRTDDLKSLNLVVLDGYILASAEYYLGRVLRDLDRI